jgi:hypothetical protein
MFNIFKYLLTVSIVDKVELILLIIAFIYFICSFNLLKFSKLQKSLDDAIDFKSVCAFWTDESIETLLFAKDFTEL